MKTISEYESLKCKMLLKYGCKKKELWLTECTTTKSFAQYYGWDTLFDLDPDNNPYCVYYHESGDVNSFAAFKDDETFESACKYVASYLS